VAEVIMIPKPGKPPHEATSYRPISLLPILSKLFEKLLLKRLKIIIEEKKLIPDHQFGFRNQHSTIDQVHRITNIIEQTLEEKKVCSTVFLDVTQAFDKVWHEGLNHKLKLFLPVQYSRINNKIRSGTHVFLTIHISTPRVFIHCKYELLITNPLVPKYRNRVLA
jgi:hypothetical protein